MLRAQSNGQTVPILHHDNIFVIIQPIPIKIWSALGLDKARAVLFPGRPCTPKRVLPIKVWITPYKPSISLVLCQCGIRLGCYIHPLRDSTSLLRFAPPSFKRTREAALMPYATPQPEL